MSVKKLQIFVVMLFVSFEFFSCAINSESTTEKPATEKNNNPENVVQTQPAKENNDLVLRVIIKAKYQKEFDAISNIDDGSFYWYGEILPQNQEIYKTTYKDYLKSSMDNLLQLYPEKSFFRVLRYVCTYDKVEISKRHMPHLNRIFEETLTFEINSKWDIEKIDTLMLLCARYDFAFNNLTKSNKEFIMALSFYVWESFSEYKLNYCKSIQRNYHEQIAWFVFDVLKNNRSGFLDNINYDVINDMIEFIFEYYDERYKTEITNLFEYSQKHFASEEFQIDHYCTVLGCVP